MSGAGNGGSRPVSWRRRPPGGMLEQKGDGVMDQKKIGAFLKALRAEKGLTQEQLAEKMLVSSRTVSRWETGSNLPDLSVLVEIADFYGVELRELLDGERRPHTMQEQTKQDTRDTLQIAAGYSAEVNRQLTRNLNGMAWLGVASFALYGALELLGLAAEGWTMYLADFALGGAFGILLGLALMTGPAGRLLFRLKRKLLGKDAAGTNEG